MTFARMRLAMPATASCTAATLLAPGPAGLLPCVPALDTDTAAWPPGYLTPHALAVRTTSGCEGGSMDIEPKVSSAPCGSMCGGAVMSQMCTGPCQFEGATWKMGGNTAEGGRYSATSHVRGYTARTTTLMFWCRASNARRCRQGASDHRQEQPKLAA